MTSNQRILEIFILLYQGTPLCLADLALTYKVSKRTIQRDFAYIRDTLATEQHFLYLRHNDQTHTYQLENTKGLKPQEVIAISKNHFFDSRALKKDELERVINHLQRNLPKLIVKRSRNHWRMNE